MNNLHHLEKPKIKQAFAAAALRYDNFAGLQRAVALQLLQRFPVQLPAGRVLDLGCGTGYLTRLIADQLGEQDMLAVDIALPMLQLNREKNQTKPITYLCADAEQLPFCAESFQQIYTNLALQWCQDLTAVFKHCQRMLTPSGQLVFATFGPATLQELKAAWASVDDFVHVNTFPDMNYLQSLLTQAGFARVTAETVVFQQTYPSVMALMQELKGIGAHNVNQGRNRRPTTRQQLLSMISHYEKSMSGVEILASYDIIFLRAELS